MREGQPQPENILDARRKKLTDQIKAEDEEKIISGSTIVDEIKAKREGNAAAEAAKKAEAEAAEEQLHKDIEAARQRISK